MDAINPLVYPVFILVATLVVVIVLVNLASVLFVRELRQHYAKVVSTWRNIPLEFAHGPEIANFLNQRRLIGARGNGVLVLTPAELRFSRIASESEIIIPLRDIEQVQLVSRFNGYRGRKPYLVIKHAPGQWTGFQVDSAEAWQIALRRLAPSTAALSSEPRASVADMQPALSDIAS